MMFLTVRSSKMEGGGNSKRSKVQTMLQRFECQDDDDGDDDKKKKKKVGKWEPVTPTNSMRESPAIAEFKGNHHHHNDDIVSVSCCQNDRKTPTKTTSCLTNSDNGHGNNNSEVQDSVQNLRKLFQTSGDGKNQTVSGAEESAQQLTPVPPLRRHRPKLINPTDSPPAVSKGGRGSVSGENSGCGSRGEKSISSGRPTVDKDNQWSPRKWFAGERGKEKEAGDDDSKDVLTRSTLRSILPDAGMMKKTGAMSAEKSDKSLPLGPPPAKPPRTFEHDVYVAQKQASLDPEQGSAVSKVAAKFENLSSVDVVKRTGWGGNEPASYAKRKSCFPDVSCGGDVVSKRNIPSPPHNIPFLESCMQHDSRAVTPYAVTNIANLAPLNRLSRLDASPDSSVPKTRSRFFVDFDEVQNLSLMKRCFSNDHIYEEVTKPCYNQHELVRTLSVDNEDMFVDNIQYDTITCQESSVLENRKYQTGLESWQHGSSRHLRDSHSLHSRSHSDSNQRKLAAHFAHVRTIHRKKVNKRQVPSYVRDIIAQSFSQVSNGSNNQPSRHSNDHPVLDEDSGDSDSELTASVVQERIKYFRTISRVPSVKYDVVNQSNQLFDYVLIVGLQSCTEKNGELQPYIKLTHPVMIETHFKQWVPHVCFPGAEFWKPSSSGETYMSVFTDETGKRTFGYCRRIKPDGCTISLPVVICVISPVLDFAFFSQFLGEIEKGYGSADADMINCLEAFRKKKLPKSGCDLTIFNQLTNCTAILRRSEDPTEDSYGLDTLLAALGSTNLIKVFASLLLERKVLLHCDSVSKLSQCVQGFYSLLYPFQWDHPFVPVLPGCVIDVLGSPTPFLIGILNDHVASLNDMLVEDVLMVDLEKNFIIHEQGDELKVIPKRLQKSLLRALKSAKSLPDSSKSVTVAESFLRMFVEAIGSYSNYIVVQQDSKKIFEKEPFCTSSISRSVNTFLQWFTETQMFYTFIDSKLHGNSTPGLFEKRVAEYKEEMENMPNTFRENVKELGKRMKNMFGGFRSPALKTIDKG